MVDFFYILALFLAIGIESVTFFARSKKRIDIPVVDIVLARCVVYGEPS